MTDKEICDLIDKWHEDDIRVPLPSLDSEFWGKLDLQCEKSLERYRIQNGFMNNEFTTKDS